MEKRKVAIQGIEASFHDVARQRFFGDKHTRAYCCDTFEEVCAAVATGVSDCGLLAIENTTAGSILTNYQLLRAYRIRIVGEVYLPVRHSLMALSGQSISEIRHVISHPMALRQCSAFLRKHKHLTQIERYDTAASAREIASQALEGVAAIAPGEASRTYGLEILAEHIENNSLNETRFLVLSTEQDLPEEECDKASLCFEVRHEVGSLGAALRILEQHGVNMTKIQSVPLPETPYMYQFHLDIIWGPEVRLKEVLNQVGEFTGDLQLLGIYKNGKHQPSHTTIAQGSFGK